MSTRSQCVCGDCAESLGHISPAGGDVTEMYIIHTLTKKHEDGGYYEGDECEIDHNHSASKSCSLVYKCDSCGDSHEDEADANTCCAKWECNFCGWVSSDSYWQNAKDAAADCCALTCEECEAYGWPDYISSHTCNTGMGTRQTLPWERRGITVNATKPEGGRDWQQVWGFDPKEYDVVQAAADYYLLEAMKAGLVGTVTSTGSTFSEEKQREVPLPIPDTRIQNHPVFSIVANEAAALFAALVEKWDPILQAYTHMACGGELRHHVAVGGAVLNGDRDTAWNGWKDVFEAVGPDALTDAAELFREFEGGSFGGDPWAQACEILHARIVGKINPALFLDRIFNAQHNGGCLLNKVEWAGDAGRYTTGQYKYTISEMTSRLLPAHGAEPEPDYSTLLAYASTEVRALFADCYKYAGIAALDMGISLSGRPVRPNVGHTQRGAYSAEQKKAAAKKAAFMALPKSKQYEQKAAEYDGTIATYKELAREEIKSNAAIEAAAKDKKKQKCGCGDPSCNLPGPGFGYASNYYQGLYEAYKKEKQDMLNKAAQYAAYEAGQALKPSIYSKSVGAW